MTKNRLKDDPQELSQAPVLRQPGSDICEESLDVPSTSSRLDYH
jgi:hypothetical protein